MITQTYHSRCVSIKLSSKARIAWDFSTLLHIKQGEKRKRYHPKSDFRLWQAAHFSTKNPINKPSDFRLWQAEHFSSKNPINKPAMNNRRLLISAVFHFVHPVDSFSDQSKQVSRCCINFPHELSWQILTNQSISSKLDFCNALLYGLFQSVIDRLQYVQKCANRLVTRTQSWEN